MRIRQIILEDFRPFFGREVLDVSIDEDTNLTLIHAENNVGKTSVLNAVLWCFYGITTSKFEQKDKIVNFAAMDAGRDVARVTVIFDHEGSQYQVIREFKQNASGRSSGKLSASRLTPSFSEIAAGEDFVNSVIPQGMAKHFFFDGEAAEAFSSETNRSEVSKAIRTMLGCDIADTALKDLGAIVKTIQKEEARALGDRRGEEIRSELDKIDSESAEAEARIEEFEGAIQQIDAGLETIDETLRNSEVSKRLHKERKGKESELRDISAQQRQTAARRVKWLQDEATSVVSRKLTEESLAFLNEGNERGRIPSPYNEEFVSEILEREVCICGRELVKGTEHWGKVAGMLSNAANANLRSRVAAVRARISDLGRRRSEAPERLREIEGAVGQLSQRFSRVEREIEDLGKKLESFDSEEISKLERSRRQLTKERQGASDNRARFVGQQAARDKERENLLRELDEASGRNVQATAFKRRAELAARCEALLAHFTEQYQKEAQERIRHLTSSFLEKTLRGQFEFHLDDDFSIYLTFPDGRIVPKSTGQNQLISLAFIVSLVQFSKERVNDESRLLTPGVVAPLVLDSPFGQLDKKYRRGIARFLPEMGDQVILLVSGSQGDEEVRQTLDPSVGREYMLVAEFEGESGDKPIDEITLHGRSYQGTRYGCDLTRTCIEEVERH